MRTAFYALLFALTFQASPQQSTGTIQGRVVRVGTSEPISGVSITLTSPSPAPGATATTTAATQFLSDQISILVSTAPPGVSPETLANAVSSLEQRLSGANPGAQQTATTDASGTFSFKGLAPGRYSLRAQRDGYYGPPINGTTTYSTIVTSTADVEAQKASPEVALAMVRGGIIAGRVRDPNGQPPSGITVSAYRLDYRDGRPTLVTVNSKTTDDRGEYRIFWLPPGDYYVSANPRRSTGVAGPQDSWARTFYPRDTDARRVPTLVVGDGTELAAIDINIESTGPGVKVSGNLINTLTAAAANFVTNVFSLIPDDPTLLTDATPTTYTNSATDRSNGHFELRGIPPGRYDLMVTVPSGPQNRPYPARQTINVGTQDLDGVRLEVLPGVNVKARVVPDGSAPPSTTVTQGIRLNLQPRENYPAPYQVAISLSVTPPPPPAPGVPPPPPPVPFLVADGSFEFTNVPPAKYGVSVAALPPTAYVADIRMGGASVYDAGFVIGREAPQMIEVIVSAGAGRVQGNVLDATKRPATGGRVVLVPQTSRRQNAALYKTANIDAKGAFNISGVTPGEYKLFAWNTITGTAYMNAEVLAKYETRGVSVRVNPGDTVNQDVQLIAVEAERR